MMSFEEKMKDLKATFRKCLDSPEPFSDDNEKATCQRMIEALPEDLVVHAANTSYAFWYLSNCSPESAPSEDDKVAMAMREARRHLSYMDGDYSKGLQNLVDALEYRKVRQVIRDDYPIQGISSGASGLTQCFPNLSSQENKLDLLRKCFSSQFEITEEEQARATEMAELVRADMTRQYTVMRGHDNQNRTIMFKFPRVKTGATEDSYILSQVYMAERSTATTEFYSLGTQERSVAVYDFNEFDSSNAPPFQMQLNAAQLLQKTFPERLGVVVMVEPPFWLRSLFNMISPFLSTTISERIKWAAGVVRTIIPCFEMRESFAGKLTASLHYLSSMLLRVQEEKEALFGPMMDTKKATPLLLAKGNLDTPVSLDHFLEDVPFYCLYDDVKCERPIEVGEQKMHKVSVTPPEQVSMSSVWSSFSSGVSIF
jgi:hypothetical protein